MINHKTVNDYQGSIDAVDISDLPVVSLKPKSANNAKSATPTKSNSSGGRTVVHTP